MNILVCRPGNRCCWVWSNVDSFICTNHAITYIRVVSLFLWIRNTALTNKVSVFRVKAKGWSRFCLKGHSLSKPRSNTMFSLHGCALTHSMVRYAEVLDGNRIKTKKSPFIATTRACINIPILYVFLLSYLFTTKKLINKILWSWATHASSLTVESEVKFECHWLVLFRSFFWWSFSFSFGLKEWKVFSDNEGLLSFDEKS